MLQALGIYFSPQAQRPAFKMPPGSEAGVFKYRLVEGIKCFGWIRYIFIGYFARIL
jgi:hypothetical protein